MSESEFMQYELAEKRLQELQNRHAIELQEAYDDIHPTRTCFDYQQCSVYWESVNPADYAIYLIELKEDHERTEKWWSLRAEAYKEAYKRLAPEEQILINSYGYQNYRERQKAREQLRELLSEIIETKPELCRQFIPLDVLEDVDEYDRRIDEMSEEELFKDYWNLDELIDEERLKEQCFRMYDAHGATYKEIGELLGIESARVKKYVNQCQREVS